MIKHLSAGVLALIVGSAAAMAAERPVIVELFTSEGCSSCPPADDVLTDLARHRGDVLPLAFHVTYWNRLGWRDPYSFEGATTRQTAYAARLGDGPYTPQLVVDGVQGLVGSDRPAVAAAIASAKERDHAGASIALRRQGQRIAITVGAGDGSGTVLLVGFDREHRTSVGRGENSGRTLLESNIVREIRTVVRWTGAPLAIDDDAPAGEDAAVLLQDSRGAIVGAARLPRS